MIHSDNLVSLQEVCNCFFFWYLSGDLYIEISFFFFKKIQVGLEQLLSDAEDFDSWSGAIRDRMVEKRMSPATRVVAVHMIFEMVGTTQWFFLSA